MRITIGIPCYQGVPAETLDDYMRFSYYLGRRYPEHEFFLAIKSKSEQFRARNAIVEASLQYMSDYLLMLDDDMVIDIEGTTINPSQSYEFIRKFINNAQENPNIGVQGVLYYQRGGECRPVLMKEQKDGGYYFLRDDEIEHKLQQVDVVGGACLFMPCSMFDKIPQPWFDTEHDYGTDIQVCKKAKEAGYEVWADTSIEFGHVRSAREVITSKNRHRVFVESASEGMNKDWQNDSRISLYQMDAQEYLDKDLSRIERIGGEYNARNFPRISQFENLDDYYRSLGEEQLCRQVLFHSQPRTVENDRVIASAINTNAEGYGLDFGCGSSPIGFDLAMRGHKIDFVDLNGTPAYDFTKWRAKKRGIDCGFKIQGPYDYVLLMDVIEHIKDWQPVMEKIISALKEDGAILTNFMILTDFENPEHVNMDKAGFKAFMVSHGVYPWTDHYWVKKPLMEKQDNERAA